MAREQLLDLRERPGLHRIHHFNPPHPGAGISTVPNQGSPGSGRHTDPVRGIQNRGSYLHHLPLPEVVPDCGAEELRLTLELTDLDEVLNPLLHIGCHPDLQRFWFVHW